MTNNGKLGTLVYLHTLDAHIMYYLKRSRKLEPYLYKLHTSMEYTYLNLDVEATICQSLKYINTRINMTPSVEYVIKVK